MLKFLYDERQDDQSEKTDDRVRRKNICNIYDKGLISLMRIRISYNPIKRKKDNRTTKIKDSERLFPSVRQSKIKRCQYSTSERAWTNTHLYPVFVGA